MVLEYNGQHYYTGIINRKGSVNENSVPGASGNYVKDTKYGKTFERKDIQPIFINEGDIVFEGRFGQSIKFGSSKQKPSVKIVAGHRDVVETLSKDDSSIYLEGGVDDSDIESKKIQIKSNDIFITGDRNIFLEADEISLNAKKGQTIKMGDPRAPMLPTVNGQKMLEFQNSIVGVLTGIQSILVSAGSQLWPKVGTDAAKLLKDISTVSDSILNLSFLNFQVLTADPDVKLPELPELPEVPEIPKADLPQVDVPKIPKTVPSLENLPKNNT